MKPRTFVVAVALGVCAAIAASAATRPTFIMNDGRRASGELVFHGGQGNNMIDDQLNLADQGKETSYSMDNVAVIDIAGGTPSQDELTKATQHDQAMVTRDGFVQGGRFVNIQNGNTLVWRNDARQEQRYGLDGIARIYLNTRRAGSIFNFNPSASTQSPSPAVGTAGAIGASPRAQRRGNSIVVPANLPWVNTGIQVKSGDQVTFRVTGQISTMQRQPPAGPEGRTGQTSDKYPIPQMQAGALIANVNGTNLFPIGSQQSPIAMPADGMLYLGINDDFFGDNTGAFTVTVTVNGRAR